MRRLFEDPEQPRALREELLRSRAAGQEYPADDKLSQLQAALSDASRQPLVEAGSRFAETFKAARVTHLGWKLAVVVVLGAGVPALLLQPAAQAPALKPTAARLSQPVAPAPDLAAAPPPTAAAESDAPTDPAPEAAAPASSSRREIAQLVRIRALLKRDPAAARRLAERSEQEFPGGLLSEERRALAIVALAKTGAHDRAALDARDFFARFPQTPLRGLIEAELARGRR